ncbi:hypothetical protein [Sulfitobacter sp. R18_1]|uniref:hypothetical protein n=1 Tax=Sulfitobacter sp. R18_1 TaxID=2821104 RepID=UPI001ADD31E2|nr:hypothetical protein [Sulfitobacter sp. R18_1]MBO9429679.1 hypothetical protein [Sulfitobacter sp. R18_1]
MQEPYDWEKAMDTTRRSAAAASQNSEHAVAGMAKLLREIDRHSLKLAKLTKAFEELQAVQPPPSQGIRVSSRFQRSHRLPVVGFLGIFIAGGVLGGYIMN